MSATNSLVPLFDHNLWANTILFDLCAGLDGAVLGASVDGCYGTILETLRHIVRGEALYVAVLTSPRPDEIRVRPDEKTPPASLKQLVTTTGEGLIRCAKEIPANEILEGVRDDGEAYRIPAFSMYIQAINHSTEHRAQIATILTQQGIEPPELDGWTYLGVVLLPQGNSE